jgi:hypothetical protein
MFVVGLQSTEQRLCHFGETDQATRISALFWIGFSGPNECPKRAKWATGSGERRALFLPNNQNQG